MHTLVVLNTTEITLGSFCNHQSTGIVNLDELN